MLKLDIYNHTMQAVLTHGTGAPNVLYIGDIEIPRPKKGEVLIKVDAFGINRPDLFQRAGLYPPPKDASPRLGLEVSGVIIDGDLSDSTLQIGDAVCALTPGGGYAPYCIAPIGSCLPIPKGLTPVEAAAIPETAFTVWSNVMDIAHLCPGEGLLVHGGASGIGTMAIQLAVALGHTVFATAGSDERVKFIEQLGAIGINYKTQDFVDVILGHPHGVNVVLDMVAGDYIDRNCKCLQMDGRIVNIAQLGGQKALVNMARVMTKRITITGSTLRPRSVAYKAQIAQALLKNVWPLFENGRIKPIINHVLPMSEIRTAHELMEAGEVMGKIVMLP